MMRKIRQSVTLHPASSIRIVTLDNGIKAAHVLPGSNAVLELLRVRPPRFFVRDSGCEESLLLELPQDKVCSESGMWEIDAWLAASYQLSSMAVIYLSVCAQGRLSLSARRRWQMFGGTRLQYRGEAMFSFSEPLVNLLPDKTVRNIHWKF